MEGDVAADRTEALKRYQADPYHGDDKLEGRSKIVSTDLRNAVLQVMPSLMRIFMGSERVVEFSPRGPDDEEGANQRTDYINLVITEDNPGYLTFLNAFKEALRQDWAVLKSSWDDSQERITEHYAGLTQDQVDAISADEEVTHVEVEEDGEVPAPVGFLDPTAAPAAVPTAPGADPSGPPPATPAAGAAPQPPAPPATVKTFAVTVTRDKAKNKVRIEHIPATEFYVTPNARTLPDARMVSHVRRMRRTDLLALGYDAKTIDDAITTYNESDLAQEELARNPNTQGNYDADDRNKATLLYRYAEHYFLYAKNDTDIAERHRVCTLGDDSVVLHDEVVPELPFFILCADPEPHKLFGNGFHALLKDIGRIKTAVWRAALDSLAMSIDSRIAYDRNRVETADLLNQEHGGVVRVTGDPNTAIRELTVPFAGQAALGMLDSLDADKEDRVGITRSSQGTDASMLQSTTKAAVTAQVTAAQARIELIARTLAETGVKELAMGVQKLLMRHQDVKRTVRLRGKWVDVDPSTWNLPLDVHVNAILGTGAMEDRMAFYGAVADKQEQLLQTIGPSPMVDFGKLRNTYAKGLELFGESDPSRYFGEVPPGWAPAPQGQQPDNSQAILQAAKLDADTKIQLKQMDLTLQTQQAAHSAHMERLKIEADFQAKIIVAQITAGQAANQAQISAATDALSAHLDAIVSKYEIDNPPPPTPTQAAQ